MHVQYFEINIYTIMSTHQIQKGIHDRVPRYTSYPTAPHFHKGIGVPEYINWLSSVHNNKFIPVFSCGLLQ